MNLVIARSSMLVLAFAALGCGARATPGPSVTVRTVPAEPAPERETARVAPEVLPPVPPPGPAPTAALPAGAPEVEGHVGQLVAVDRERALVAFHTREGERNQLWLASMRRDGSLTWARSLGERGLARPDHDASIFVLGDAVSITLQSTSGDSLELMTFALADGAPRATVTLGAGSLGGSVSDGARRFDTRVSYGEGGVTAELIATTGAGVAWRAAIGPSPPPGHSPLVIGDALVLRTSDDFGNAVSWLAFERATGRRLGALPGLPQTCTRGGTWVVRTDAGLVEVALPSLRTRVISPAQIELPEAGSWAIEDCSFAGDELVVLAARGRRRALVAVDRTSGEVRGHVALGAAAIGLDGFDPLPDHAPAIVTLRTLENDRYGVLVVDPRRSRSIGRWQTSDEHGSPQLVRFADGVILSTRHVLSIVSGTGALEGRAMRDQSTASPWEIADAELWLRPEGSVLLGRFAPRVVSLRAAVDPSVRDAVLADVSTPAEGDGPCPDPQSFARNDGIGASSGPLGAVASTRLPSWDLDILRETARSFSCAPGSAPARLLAWYVMEDDRPLRNHNALLLVEDTRESPTRYTLVQVYRHATNRDWNVNASFHSRTEPIRAFDHRPTRADVDAFLAQSGFAFADSWGRVLSGNVLDAEWHEALGELPWVSFPPGIERPD